MVTGARRLDLHDPIDIHDGRTANSDEVGAQSRTHLSRGSANVKSPRPHMKLNVVAVSLTPIDVTNGHAMRSSIPLYQEMPRGGLWRGQLRIVDFRTAPTHDQRRTVPQTVAGGSPAPPTTVFEIVQQSFAR